MTNKKPAPKQNKGGQEGEGGWGTKAVVGGRHPQKYNGLVNPPIYHGSTVLFDDLQTLLDARDNPFGKTFYGRMGTPTIFALEEGTASLYGADKRAVATCSGLAAIVCVFHTYLQAGDTLLISDGVYEPTRRYCTTYLKRLGIRTVFYPPTIDVADMADYADTQSVKMLFMESPSSLTFDVQDVSSLAAWARQRNIISVIDNTWANVFYYNPFEHGVDITIEAATKYITGHADAMLGVIVCEEARFRTIKSCVVAFGNAPGPDACYLGQRGLRTLPLRMPKHQENALLLASRLRDNKNVHVVLHPAFEECPGHAFWQRDFRGSSGLFSFVLPQRDKTHLAAMMDNFQLFGLGYSWGGYESLILPVSLHPDSLPQRFEAVPALKDGQIIRVHAGLEDGDDLWADLSAGLARYFS
ncbi:MAG: cystathionine beta-lyase [Alphaproteobacteria bacterium GM202ARS2]|nr:cystathionine beta-lyase [Alphaproteobacteria bacterium GM202ARS2]